MLVDEAKLTEYALGMLNEQEEDLVQQQIDASSDLQNEWSSLQDTLKVVALAEMPMQSSERLRSLVLDATAEKAQFCGFMQRFSDLFDLDELKSQALLDKINHYPDLDWESTLFSGVKILTFEGGPRVASATCGFVQVESGKLFPAHQHQADECVLVLQGAACDDSDQILQSGDMFVFEKGSQHSFRIISQEAFIFAVVLYKKNKWLLLKTLLDHFRH